MAKHCTVCGRFNPKRRKDKPSQVCSKTCRQVLNGRAGRGVSGRRGQARFKGGRYLEQEGYVMASAKNHRFQRRVRYLREHVMVMELAIGRRLHQTECVHHINGVKTDNRLVNLQLMTFKEHSRLTRKEHAARPQPL